MQVKNKTSDTVLVDYDIYLDMLNALYDQSLILNRIRERALGWKSLNGQLGAIGDEILRMLDNQT